jgi:hypothetical protein
VRLFWAAVIVAASFAVNAYSDMGCEERLKRLRVLTPAVMAEKPGRAALLDFSEALPPDFACFNHLFGYSETDGPAPLYSEPQLHFLFPKIAAVVPKEVYARKLVGLCVNAKWEADQTGALQDAARSVLDTETPLFVRILGELGIESERSVWEFLFGGPHPSNEPLSSSVEKRICETSMRSCELSRQVYARALSEEHTH